MKKITYLFLFMPLFAVLNHSLVMAADEESDLQLIYGDDDFTNIATGSRQLLSKAPAVATVLTSQDIINSGATDIDQVLELIPGLHVSVSASAYNPKYIIRGIHSQFNPEVLILIDGTPITSLFHGDRGNIWGGMPVNNIARIEVIRGPGSAIYGADALAGVINIVTKTAARAIKGTETGVRAGSFGSRDAWLLNNSKWNDYNFLASIELHTTDGHTEEITSDAQTSLDGLFVTNASLAPGPVSLQRDTIDTKLQLSRNKWNLGIMYQGRRNIGTGAGAAEALDPVGDGQSERIMATFSHHNPDLTEHWEMTTHLSYLDYNQQTYLVLFPPGAFGGTFPDGMIGNPDVNERHARLGTTLSYTGFSNHQIGLGLGVNYGSLYKIKETKNFTFVPGNPIPQPLGSIVDTSNTLPFIQTGNRKNYYFFLQDEWSLAQDWNLTSGVRYDSYSDFGYTINPRLALVWQTTYNLTSKLLYGRAFRAPSFAEQFNLNNPVALGNPELDPETIDTLELAFYYQPTARLSTGLNLFYYKIRDSIRFTPDLAPATTNTAQNQGEQTGSGAEWEADWKMTKKIRLKGNYAYQHSINDETGNNAGDAPQNQAYLRSDWNFLAGWHLNVQGTWIADRRRVEADNRPNIENYTLIDAGLRYQQKQNRWGTSLFVRNLFDEDAREPNPAPGFIVNDLPLAGRNVYAELRYNF